MHNTRSCLVLGRFAMPEWILKSYSHQESCAMKPEESSLFIKQQKNNQ